LLPRVIGDYIAPMSSPLSFRIILCCALLCRAAALTTPVSADPGQPYGRDFLLVDADAAGVPQAPMAAVASDQLALARDAVERLQALVEQLELRDGPYSGSLSEPLSDLALQLERLGRGDEAQRLRERALHLLRVNEGLYSLSQLPLVRALLDAERRRGDYAALDQRYGYFFRLYGNGQPPFTEPRMRATLEYLRWQREAVVRGLDADPRQRLLSLIDRNEQLLQRLSLEAEQPWVWLRDAALSQLANLYLLAEQMQHEVLPPQRLGGFAQPSVRRDFDEFDPRRERLLSLGRSLRPRGSDLLEQLLARAPDAVERAAVQREYGDWEQWLGQTTSADDWYHASWQTLRDSGDTALVESWYGTPQPLPANGAFTAGNDEPGLVLVVSLSVDARGRADDVQVQERADARREATRLRRWLRETRFRPALDANGEPVASAVADVAFRVF
jgi:hypothetical protein